jgi:hypothetical protein
VQSALRTAKALRNTNPITILKVIKFRSVSLSQLKFKIMHLVVPEIQAPPITALDNLYKYIIA